MELLKHPQADSKEDLLAVVEHLRAKIEAGEIVAFIGVGIAQDDYCEAWQGAAGRVSRLRIMGAVAHLQLCLHAGEV